MLPLPNRTILTLTLIFSLLFLSIGIAAPEAVDVSRSVVALKQGKFVECSGFVIAPTYVMTADHCLEGATELYTVDGILAPEEVFHGGDKWDVAILRLATPTNRPPLRVATSVTLSTPLKAYGFPGGKDKLKVLDLRISLLAFHFDDPEVFWVAMQPDVKAGMSGGPIVNPAGEVLAIIQVASPGFKTSVSRIVGPIWEVTKEFWTFQD